MGIMILSREWVRRGENDVEDRIGGFWKILERMNILIKKEV